MISLFNRIMSKVSLFWRFLFFLSMMMFMFLSALLLSSHLSSAALKKAYLQQVEQSFYENAQSFSDNLFRTTSLPPSIERAEYYRQITMATRPLSHTANYHLSEIRETFEFHCSLLDLPSESFLYLGHIQSCVTRNRMFPEFEDCFNSYIVYENLSVPDLLETMSTKSNSHYTLSFLPVNNVRINGAPASPYLTLLVKSTAKSQVYGFLYSMQSVLDCFHINTLPEDTSLTITHSDGTDLFSHNATDPDSHIKFSFDLSSLSCRAVIGIPQSYFQETIRDAQSIAYIIFLLSAVLGILMCFLFSHINIQPIRRLVQIHTDDKIQESPANELMAIDTFLKTVQERNAALSSMLMSSLLMRAFSGLPIPEEECKTLSLSSPLFQEPLYAAILRDRDSGPSPDGHSSMIQFLQVSLPEQFLCEYINTQEFIVLFQAESSNCELLQCVLLDLNNGLELQPRLVCGISAPFVGLSEISCAIRQAQFCIPEDGERMVTLFNENSPGSAALLNTTSFDLKQFQQALACWNQQEMLIQIDAFSARVGTTAAAQPEEVFYSILYLLREAAYGGKLSFEAHEKAAYQHNSPPTANFNHLKGIITDLFDQRLALQMSEKQQLCQNIVKYITDHFTDPTLCLFSLAQQFCVSERFVHTAILSITGTNFSNFLASTRMQEAARLLRDTDESINAVAEQCGYTVLSTFYRNFRKYYHITPVEYKNSLP